MHEGTLSADGSASSHLFKKLGVGKTRDVLQRQVQAGLVWLPYVERISDKVMHNTVCRSMEKEKNEALVSG